jgi:hypothetical protein
MFARLEHKRRWTTLAFVGAAIGGVAVIWVLVSVLFFPPTTQVEQEGSRPIESQQTPTDNAVSQMRQAFGPWTLVDQPRSDTKILLLHSNGSLEEGSVVVHPDATWQKTVVSNFRDIIRRDGHVDVRTTSGAIFRIAYRQAFVLENEPQQVLAFMPNGTIVSISTGTIYTKDK